MRAAANNMLSEVVEDDVLQPMRMAAFYCLGKDILLPWQLPDASPTSSRR
ncbi:hypothetical protein ACFW9N_18535 [Streptomyces sp. NPDC059496]